MKKKTRILVLFLFLVWKSVPANKNVDQPSLIWHTDLKMAQEASVATGKPLFAFFTGSDWCPWCKKLQRDVFLKQEFIDWANKNVVLLEVDFPRNKVQNPALADQNRSLQQAFQVRGYPTVWLFFLNKNKEDKNYTIKSIGSLGYPAGAETGKEEIKFLGDVNALLEDFNRK